MIRGRNQSEIIGRIKQQMEKSDIDAILLTSAGSIFYATGFAVRSLYRSGKTGNAAVLITKEGKISLICSEFERNAAVTVCDSSINIVSYPVWIYIEDYAVENMIKEVQPDLNKTYKIAVSLLDKTENITLGVESKWINYDAGCYLKNIFGADCVKDCTKLLSEARSIKTKWEIDVLRHNAQLAEKAMNMVAKQFVAGMTTEDIHYLFHKTCLELAPDMTAVSQSHTIADDIAPAWIPSQRRIEIGDLVRLDGGPYTNGYKSDLGRTYAVGNVASKDKIELYNRLYRGYKWGIEHIGPGVKMSDIFKGTQEAIGMKEYIRGHHGHSISCDISGEEAPFIAPLEDRVFEVGMVMCFETPFYSSKRHTYNIEDTFVVTEDGIELFTRASNTMFV